MRRTLLGLTATVAAVGVELASGSGMPEAAGDLAAGLTLVVGGIVLLGRERGGCAPWMLIAGSTWFAGDVWDALLYVHRGPLAHLLLTYPRGRTSSRPVLAVIAAAYLDGIVPSVARGEWPTIVLAAALIAASAWRYGASGGIERRPRAVALAATVTVAAPLAFAAIARLAGIGGGGATLWAYFAGVTLTGSVLTVDALWGHWARAAVTELVIELGDRHQPQALRAALARTLGDPGLEVAYRVPATQGWVDEVGGTVELPDPRDGRTVTLVRDDGEPVAALVHDPAALGDGELAASVEAAARLALANVRIQADVAARVREVAASRRRLVETGDEERRGLDDELRAGPERRLLELGDRLARLAAGRDGPDAEELRRLSAELEDVRHDLLRFAQGVHPRTLTELGLDAALTELADHAVVPVDLSVTGGRFPPAHEAAVYFVCSEALANVAKYAGATHVDISVAPRGGWLVLRVVDDGVGGAEPARGSGLRGLVDRVEAVGGRLTMDSKPGIGTRLEAELPIPPTGVP